MKKSWPQHCLQGVHFCGACCLSLLCWTLWLGLSVLLALQLYIALTRELPIPTFVVRNLETRLAASGIQATLGRTSFDPTGRILVENTRLSIGSFEEPVATAKLLYLHLDPWDLLAGNFTPQEFHASGVSLQVPAMFSATGRNEDALSNITLSAQPTKHGLELSQLTARLGNLSLTANGSIDLRSLPKTQGDSIPLAEFLVRDYAKLCRQFEQLIPHLNKFEHPSAHITFRPSEKLGAIARITLRAGKFQDDTLKPLSIGSFTVSTQLPLWSQKTIFARIALTADSLELPHDIQVDGLRATFRARLAQDKTKVTVQHTNLEAYEIQASGITASSISAHIDTRRYPQVSTRLLAHIGAEPIEIRGTADAQARSAVLQLAGRFDPELMRPLGEKLGRDIRPFLNFGAAPEFDLALNIAPGAKFTDLTGQVSATDVYAYRVTFDQIGGQVAFDGKHFVATDAKARIGTNFARGSYEHEFPTHQFRFLLKGQLDPPDIGGWFRQWWPNFWGNFDFSSEAPDAEVDVQGRWRHGPKTSVFVYADASSPVIKNVALDHVTTRIFVRPHHYHATGLLARLNGGEARGSFLRSNIPYTKTLHSMEFNFRSTLPPEAISGLTSPQVAGVIEPFTFTKNPELTAKGTVWGPGQNDSEKRHLEIQGYTDAPLTFHHFPLNNLSFSAVVDGDEISIEPLTAGFAEGVATGKVSIQGKPKEQRMGFDLNLKDANLREASVILDAFFAHRRNEPPSTTSDYVEQTANVSVDLDVSAIGNLDDPYSYHGGGSANLNGSGLGKIRLLGLLSELLNFTALSFTNLRTNFTVQEDHLQFSEVSLTGSNAAVNAHGIYIFEPNALNFNAKVYPFQESEFILKSVVGAVLTPLSNVLEVKLTGNLSKPKWAFVIGPTNFLRNLFPNSKNAIPEPVLPLAPTQSE